MKCPKCNYDNLFGQKFCGNCGAKLEDANNNFNSQPGNASPQFNGAPQNNIQTNTAQLKDSDKTLRAIAFAFGILSCVGFGWLVLPLAWMIPMTVHCWKLYKGEKVNTVGYGVCSLIFLNFVTGILLLISTKDV